MACREGCREGENDEDGEADEEIFMLQEIWEIFCKLHQFMIEFHGATPSPFAIARSAVLMEMPLDEIEDTTTFLNISLPESAEAYC